MQDKAKSKLAAAIAVGLGLSLSSAARAGGIESGNAAPKSAASSLSSKILLAQAVDDKSQRGVEAGCKGKEGSCKGKEGSCKGK